MEAISTKQFNAMRAAASPARIDGDLPAIQTAGAKSEAVRNPDADADDELTAKARRERAKAIAADRPANGGLNERERQIIASLKAATYDVRALTLESGGHTWQAKRAIVQRHLGAA